MKADVTLLAGVPQPVHEPWEPFSPLVLDFLDHLSAAARKNHGSSEELAAFGFWCRRSHLETLKQRHASPLPRLGRGLLFHLAPSNVPTMFAYTYVIGLLAGNAGLVRLSERRGKLEEQLLALLSEVLEQPEFAPIKVRSSFITYPRNDETTAALMANCDGRVIWGGDATVRAMRSLPMPPHAVELCFPDRWSLALLSQKALSEMDTSALADLAHRFYNDTYLMDQNACSSPQLVLWLTDGGEERVRRRWWDVLAAEAAARYPMEGYQAARKYERLCTAAMTGPEITLERFGGNLVYVARLNELPTEPVEWKGGFGTFFEGAIPDLERLLPLLSPKAQTLSCGGLKPDTLAAFLARHHATGIDRVVPIGQAMEMDTIWDGKDLIAALSRVIAQ